MEIEYSMDDEVNSLQCNMFCLKSDVHICTLRPVLERVSCEIDLIGQLDIVTTKKNLDRLIKFLTALISSTI